MTPATLHIYYPPVAIWPAWLLPLALGLHPWAWVAVALLYALPLLRPTTLRLRLPGQWQQVPQRRRPRLLRAMLLYHLGHYSRHRLLLEALRACCPMPRWVWLHLPPQGVQASLLPHMAWVAQASLTHTWQPVLRIAGRRWRLPRPDATDMTLHHYLQAEAALPEATQARHWAVFLAAYLAPYSPQVAECLPTPTAHSRAAAQRWLRWAGSLRAYYVLAYYEAQRALLRQHFPDAFRAAPPDAPTPAAPAAPPDVAAILATVVQSGELGSIQDIAAMPARTFLAWTDSKRRQQREAEQRRLQELVRANHQKFLA